MIANSGSRAVGAASLSTWLYIMDAQKSPENKQPQNDCLGTCVDPQCSSNPSSHHSESVRHFSSNGSISYVDTSLQHEPHEYNEMDPLLSNELYSGSSRSTREKDVVSSGGPPESMCSMVLQILVPFLLAGLGTVSAGVLLDVVQVRSSSIILLFFQG